MPPTIHSWFKPANTVANNTPLQQQRDTSLQQRPQASSRADAVTGPQPGSQPPEVHQQPEKGKLRSKFRNFREAVSHPRTAIRNHRAAGDLREPERSTSAATVRSGPLTAPPLAAALTPLQNQPRRPSVQVEPRASSQQAQTPNLSSGPNPLRSHPVMNQLQERPGGSSSQAQNNPVQANQSPTALVEPRLPANTSTPAVKNPVDEFSASLDQIFGDHDQFDQQLRSPAVTPSSSRASSVIAAPQERADAGAENAIEEREAVEEHHEPESPAVSSQTRVAGAPVSVEGAPVAKRTNPFSRLNHWVTHDSEGRPTNKLRKSPKPEPTPEPQMRGTGIQFQLSLAEDTQPAKKKQPPGKALVFHPNTSPEMKAVLSKTLAAHGRQFLEVEQPESSAENHNQAFLKDNKGFSHYLISSDTGMIALHTSVSKDVYQGAGKGKARAEVETGQPDSNHFGLINGVFKDTQGNALRMHDGHLMRFDNESASWKPEPAPGVMPWVQLQSSNGRLTAQVAPDASHFQIRDLTNDQNVLFESDKPVTAHHYADYGALAVLVTDDKNGHEVSIMTPDADGSMSKRSFRFHLNAFPSNQPSKNIEAGRPAQVALSNGILYIADSHGELYSVALNDPREMAPDDNGSIPLRHHTTDIEGLGDELPRRFITNTNETQKGRYPIKGFFTDNEGTLQAVVQGRYGQLHSCPELERGKLALGWNLSDTLAFSNKNGIQTPPSENSTVHIDRYGSLKTHAGRLQYRDTVTRLWQEMPGNHNIRSISRGLDGHSYVVADGQVRKLAFSDASDQQTLGANIYNPGIQRNQPSVGGQLTGSTAADNFVSAAVLNTHQFIGLNDDGEATVVNNSRAFHTAMQPSFKLPLTGIPEGQKLTNLYVDGKHNLVGLTDKGQVLRMPESAWGKRDTARAAQWQLLEQPSETEAGEEAAAPAPEAPAEVSAPPYFSTRDRQQLTLHRDGKRWNLSTEGDWKRSTAEESPDVRENTPFDIKFKRLADAQKSKRVLGREVKFKAGLLGFNNAEKTQKVQSGFRERLRAHYFRLDTQTPRPLKIAGKAIQHQYKGRDGLDSLYKDLGKLHTTLHTRSEPLAVKRESIDERLHKLKHPELNPHYSPLAEEGLQLLDEIQHLRDELDTSSFHSLALTAVKAGLIDKNGRLKSKAKHQNTSGKDDNHNLAKELKNIWSNNGMQASRSETARLLEALDEAGIELSHPHNHPGNRRRDISDDSGLTKARLILNAVTLDKLDSVLTRLEGLSLGNAQSQSEVLSSIRNDFLNIRDNEYRNQQVRTFTDMGHGNFKDLENNYDTLKGFVKGFHKDDHGVAMTSRSALDAKDKQQLKEAMRDVILSLKEGDSISFGRAYDGGISTTYNPVSQAAIFTSVMAGLTSGVARSMTFLRDEGDLIVSLGKNKARGISLGGFFGQNLIPIMQGVELNDPAFSHTLQKDVGPRWAGFDLRAGFISAATFARTGRSGLDFSIDENAIEKFVNDLIDGETSVTAMMEEGANFENKHGRTLSFSFDLNGSFGVRAGTDATEHTSNPFARIRGELGLRLSSNLATYAHTKDENLAQAGKRDVTAVKAGIFNNFNASVGAWLQTYLNLNLTDDGSQQLQDYGSFNGIEGSISFDDWKTRQVDVQVKQAAPISHDAVNNMIDRLGARFTDKKSQEEFSRIRNLQSNTLAERPGAADLDLHKLAELITHMSHQLEPTLEQRATINELVALNNKALAHKKRTCQLGEVKYTSTYTNLSHINKDSMTEVLLSHLSKDKASSTAKRVQEYAAHDPKLQSLIETMRNTPNAVAKVTMEIKPSVKLAAELCMANGTISGADVALLMKDPNNLRIRDIKVLGSASLSETFTPLQVIIGGGSMSSVSMDKKIGQIYFKYPADDSDSPHQFNIQGAIATGDSELRAATASLAERYGQELS
ncbi:AvrE-family type 3 secretion system effector [Pokkaliibacter sp. CJK22405]|uniref:AvrE-family type 3 secretion system effector n=1 Tax=Pokkaliibacter sp. CJK22405 TaxID=3384615 RepID=UPI003984E3AD